MAPSACRAVRVPSQTPTSPAPTVSSRTVRPRPPPCRSRMTSGSTAPGRPCRSSVTSGGHDQATSSRASSSCSASQVRARSPASTVGPIASATGPRWSTRSVQVASSCVRALEGDHPEPDALDAAGGEVGQPRRVQVLVPRRPAPGAGVPGPELGVLGWVLVVALHHPGVEAGPVEPRGPDVAPGLSGAGLPVADEQGDPAGLEVVARPCGPAARRRSRRPGRRRGTRRSRPRGVVA